MDDAFAAGMSNLATLFADFWACFKNNGQKTNKKNVRTLFVTLGAIFD